MNYIVIELKDNIHILTENNDKGLDPAIFKDKNSAFRAASECNQGLVYPIIDIMKMLDEIKLLAKDQEHSAEFLLNRLFMITDEII
jgi:hypothetical protein